MSYGRIEPIPVLYTPEEVAEAAKVSRRTVYRWIASGYLPARKVGLGEAWTVTHSDLALLLSGALRGRKVTGSQESKSTPAPSKSKPQSKRRR